MRRAALVLVAVSAAALVILSLRSSPTHASAAADSHGSSGPGEHSVRETALEHGMRMLRAARCSKIFIDVGANRGDTLEAWVSANKTGDASRFSRKLFAVAERRRHCLLAFEANPHFDAALARVATSLRPLVPAIVVFNGTAFATRGGDVTLGLDDGRRDGSSLLLSKRVKPLRPAATAAAVPPLGAARGAAARAARTGDHTVRVAGMEAGLVLAAIRDAKLGRSSMVLKIDVEGLEFALLRHLVRSGVLCSTVHHLIIEWHTARSSGPLFNVTAEGLPSSMQASDLQTALLWLLQSSQQEQASPDCPVRMHKWV